MEKPPAQAITGCGDAAGADREEGRRLSARLASAGGLLAKPITPEQLQAEMDRMAQDTKQPDMLREIFEALGNDPFVVAATDWFTQHLQP